MCTSSHPCWAPSFAWYLVDASLLKEAVHSRVVHGACEAVRLLRQLRLKVVLLKPSNLPSDRADYRTESIPLLVILAVSSGTSVIVLGV